MKRRKIMHGRVRRFRQAYYAVRVYYNGGIIDWLEAGLFKAAGRMSNGSGCWMSPPYKRDHEWEFVKLSDARSCYKRISEFLFGPHNHPVPTRSIELWDEKPRKLTAHGVVTRFKRVPGGAPALRRRTRKKAA